MDEYAQKIEWTLQEGSEVEKEVMKVVAERVRKEQETKEEYEDKLPF